MVVSTKKVNIKKGKPEKTLFRENKSENSITIELYMPFLFYFLVKVLVVLYFASFQG